MNRHEVRYQAAARQHSPLFSWGWIVVAAVLVVGCGEQRPSRYPVEGILSVDGQPVPQGMQLLFTPEGPDAEPCKAVTNDSGRYIAYHKPGMKGLLPRRYVVSVVSPDDDASGTLIIPPQLAGIKIPDRYRVGKSELKCDVGRTGVVFDIDLVTK